MRNAVAAVGIGLAYVACGTDVDLGGASSPLVSDAAARDAGIDVPPHEAGAVDAGHDAATNPRCAPPTAIGKCRGCDDEDYDDGECQPNGCRNGYFCLSDSDDDEHRCQESSCE